MITSMLPLSGYTVAVTAARKADELITLLERQGASINHAPTLRSIALENQNELHQAVEALIRQPAEMTIVTTGVGFRALIDTAETWDLKEQLLESLALSTIITRGPKATGAVRGHNLLEAWSPTSETSAELVEHLLAVGVEGKRIAVQLHGATPTWDPHVNAALTLETAGANIVPLPVYQWALPENTAAISELIQQICSHLVDVITFTSAPAVLSIFDIARKDGRYHQLITRFQQGCLVVCIGPVTAEPLTERNIPFIMPERSRLAAMVKELTQHIQSLGATL